MSELVLGIDGGGTSTIAWIADKSGNVLGKGRAGPSNPKSIGFDRARASLNTAISAAWLDYGKRQTPVGRACFGLAGFARADDQAILNAWVTKESWAESWINVTDAELVLAAGTPDGVGVALIAGTGSIAIGRSSSGDLVRVGGWGPLIGDEGSGYRIALDALRLVMQRLDGRAKAPSSSLLDARLKDALGVAEPAGIVSTLYSSEEWDRARIGGLARIVMECAEDDPELVAQVVEPATDQLIQLAQCTRAQLHLQLECTPLALAGGLLLSALQVRQRIKETLAQEFGPIQTVETPVSGAIRIASGAINGWQ